MISVIPQIYDYNDVGYRIQIKLIYRITKDPDQALYSVSTIQKFPALYSLILVFKPDIFVNALDLELAAEF